MQNECARFGIDGLDSIISGGLPKDRVYLVQGDPGSGKTTMALQFLLHGAEKGERGLYITLSETAEELRAVARSHGWSLDKIEIFELAAMEESLKLETQQTVFPPSEVDLNQTTQKLLDQCERVQPARVIFDSCAEMRLLAQSALRYRRQILALKQYFAGRRCTVLLLDDRTADRGDLHVQSLAHGVIELEQTLPDYGAERRRLRVVKLRGVKFSGGYHDFHIATGGLIVHPRIQQELEFTPRKPELFSSGIPALDRMLGGGLERGSSTLFIGPAGCGKSTLATQYINAAMLRKERAVFYSFEEGPTTFFTRARGLGMDVEQFVANRSLVIKQLNPAALSSGQFTQNVKDAVDSGNASIVVIDSLNGYLNAVADERFLSVHLRDLLAFLGRRNVLVLLVVAQQGMIGAMQTPIDVSYLADTVVLLRYFEHAGRIQKSVSVVKRRGGPHETNIREMSVGSSGIEIGPPLEHFQGVLTGVPIFRGQAADLLKKTHA
ncbi:MAG TPA: ATPase domain-containing protein [Planctomycetota bacterium]|nr:ATPase domain-containing protein [Planctomycetota bacterium]